MPTTLNRASVKQHLDNFDLRTLFTQELGWDHGGIDAEVTVKDRAYSLQAIAHKRGMVAYKCLAQPGEEVPDHPTRQQIERRVAQQVREHIIIFADHDRSTQYWLWVKREPGRPDRPRTHIYRSDQSGEPLIQKLERIVFTLEDEADLSIVDVTGHVLAAFDVEKVTKKFYDRFKNEHQDFLGFIEGIENVADREWYASLMLNRMMFIYFIQKRSFLDNNPNYLRDRLHTVRQQHGVDRFDGFYRLFLLRLFHEGLGVPETERDAELVAELGQVPYLNGGLFDVHDLEHDYPDISIPDEAFEKIFVFFDAYQWHLDDRPLRNDNEINPDVLGYIFEKYINQKQMGAYYTKEDITGYISRNTIIPFLFDRAKKECPIAFQPNGGVWRLLQEDPDGYFYEAVRHGITYDVHNNEELDARQALPLDIAAGLDNVAQRVGWNEPAPEAFALPTETWREHVARRRRYEEIYAKLASGEVTSINDLITYNLNIEKFTLDAIANSEGPELVRGFWKAIVNVSVLDPTCGSGAFLFAALNILEPLYSACLEAMDAFLDDLEHSQRPHSPLKLSDFRKILDHVAEHASVPYYILKSIVVGNLYGVDIMEEAVEICKLRLFLKLVAQLETYDQIEPLPDIDFNVRAGNTLVGFTTLQEIRDSFAGIPGGQSRMLYAEEEEELRRIEEDAEVADRQFQLFHKMQTEFGMTAADFADAKLKLRLRLDALRAELDRYLSKEYGATENDERDYVQWRTSHQPFHWFVEFYGIMHSGGFDVIVGNPPYVEYRTVKDSYSVRGLITQKCGNLYAMTWERTIQLASRGRLGLIVPASSVCTDGYTPLRELLSSSGDLVISHFSDSPGKLFQELPHNRLSIILLNKGVKSRNVFSTTYNKWRPNERDTLFQSLTFCDSTGFTPGVAVPKLGHISEASILQKLNEMPLIVNASEVGRGPFAIYYTRKLSHFVQILDFIPKIYDAVGHRREPSELKQLYFRGRTTRDAMLSLLNSSLFYWLITLMSDCRNLNRREIRMIRFDLTDKTGIKRLASFAPELMEDIRENSRIRKQGSLRIQETYPRKSKAIIDKIDVVLANHYGFTDQELDFIVNYDIKYRMGW